MFLIMTDSCVNVPGSHTLPSKRQFLKLPDENRFADLCMLDSLTPAARLRLSPLCSHTPKTLSPLSFFKVLSVGGNIIWRRSLCLSAHASIATRYRILVTTFTHIVRSERWSWLPMNRFSLTIINTSIKLNCTLSDYTLKWRRRS